MKTKLLFGSAALFMLGACSSEETVLTNQDTQAINFGVTAAPSTRAEQSYCNTNLPGNFTVFAAKAGTSELYIDGDAVTGVGNPKVYTADITRYWPEYALDFHAHVNGEGTYAYENGVAMFKNFKVENSAAAQKDLLYAVRKNQSRQTVKLNFHHALSQIVFKAQNNSGLDIEVSGVAIGNVHTQGTYTFPSVDTDPNYENHSDQPNGQFSGNRGAWAGVENSAVARYDVNFEAKAIGTETVELTGVNHNGGADNSLILMPQTVAAWNPAVPSATFKGAYFLVKVKISYPDNNVVIYDNYAALPVNVEWEEGVRYIYTFKFAAGGNGGYLPDPNNPLPVLEGITYDVTTDDFIPVGKDENMNTGNETKLNNAYITLDNGQDATPATQTLQGSSTGNEVGVNLPSQAPVRDGYKFLGWTDAEGNEYALGQRVTVPAGETLNLTAKWEKEIKNVTYTINFLANSQDETVPVTGMPQSLTVTVPETTTSYEFTIPENVPVHGNWGFGGWGYKKVNYADDEKLVAGDKVTVNLENPVLNLYAIWTVNFTGGDTPDSPGADW